MVHQASDGESHRGPFLHAVGHRSHASKNPAKLLCYKLRVEHSEIRQRAGQELETKVFLVSQSIGPALDNSDLVVDPLDETQRNFVLRVAMCLDAIPVSLSCFAVPQLRQHTRRISNSRYTRVSPQERSRTRRIL